MLILSRKFNEAVYIGGDIRVMVVEIVARKGQRPKVRLGFEAPPELPVHRDEVVEAMRRQGKKLPSLGEIIQGLTEENNRLKRRIEELTSPETKWAV